MTPDVPPTPRPVRAPVASRRSAVAAAVGRFRRDTRGQSILFSAFTIFALVIMALMILGVEQTTTKKIRLQNAADVAALSAVQIEADALAQIAWINEAMASIYYDMMRACVDTGASAVYAQLADYKDLSTWAVDPATVVTGGSSPQPPSGFAPANAREKWETMYSRAAVRVQRGEKWLRRLSRVQRAIALMTPELMRHQLMYAARRNLAADALTPAEIKERVRVACYPDLNRTGLHQAAESKTFTFLSDEDASVNRALITKIGTPGQYPNGWEFDAVETNDFHMLFNHLAHDDKHHYRDADSSRSVVIQFFGWAGRGVGWTDAWEASVREGDSSIAYAVKFRDTEKEDITDIDDAPSRDYLIRRAVDGSLTDERLIRHRKVTAPRNKLYSYMERVEVFNTINSRWTDVHTLRYAHRSSGRFGGTFEEGDREILVWEQEGGGRPSTISTPDERIVVRANGRPGIWDPEKGEYVDPPESFQLTEINGILVPVTMADRFYLGGPDDGAYLAWCMPMSLCFGRQWVTLSIPLHIQYHTPVGCHGYVSFSDDDISARVHGLSTLSPSKTWSTPHNDRRRHRLYTVADDRWRYEWVDAGPCLRDMDTRRFGYHALMDRLHAGVDYAFPRPADDDGDEEEVWNNLLSDTPRWPWESGNGSAPHRSVPGAPERVPLWARKALPLDADADDTHDDIDPDADEPFGGWFDIASCRPQDITRQSGSAVGAYNPAAFSKTVPCWYCGDKGVPGNALVDLASEADAPPYRRGQTIRGVTAGCGFWHETFLDQKDYDLRVTQLRNAQANFIAAGMRDTDDDTGSWTHRNPYPGLYTIQVTCPFACRREWDDGSRPARLADFGPHKVDSADAAYAQKVPYTIPTYVRVTLRDAATLSFTHPNNEGKKVVVRDAGENTEVSAADHRPPRHARAVDYGYRHIDSSTHWVRDYFGVWANNRRDRKNSNGEYLYAVAIPGGNATQDDEPADFWEDTPPPLEVHALTGELFRLGFTVMVWADVEDWKESLWPSGKGPQRSADVSDQYKKAVHNAMTQDGEINPLDAPLPPPVSDAERNWSHGRVDPLEEVPWRGMFGMASARVLPPPLASSTGTARFRHDFPWDDVDVNDLDFLGRVVNPRRDEWLDSPANLFDPDWRAGLVPVGAARDLRDLESDVMSGETDLVYFMNHDMTRSIFRYGVAARDNADEDRTHNGEIDGPMQIIRYGLTSPPMQENKNDGGGHVHWGGRVNGYGIEQAVVK